MTKIRDPYTIADAVTQIIGTVDVKHVAEALERSTGLVRQWADPDCAAKPDLHQAIELDVLYRQATDAPFGPMQRFLEVRTHKHLAPAWSVNSAEEEVWDVIEHAARLTLAVNEARSKSYVAPSVKRELSTCLSDLRREIDEAEAALNQPEIKEAAQ